MLKNSFKNLRSLPFNKVIFAYCGHATPLFLVEIMGQLMWPKPFKLYILTYTRFFKPFFIKEFIAFFFLVELS
jgi:hypothetical protein